MSITLTNNETGATLELPEDLIWSDELTWSAVAQDTERGIYGTLLVDVMARHGGRPITLQGSGGSAWISRGTLRQLKAWADVPGLRMQLDLRGEIFTVIFDHGPAEETRLLAMLDVVDFSDKQDDDYYCNLTLRFLEASELL